MRGSATPTTATPLDLFRGPAAMDPGPCSYPPVAHFSPSSASLDPPSGLDMGSARGPRHMPCRWHTPAPQDAEPVEAQKATAQLETECRYLIVKLLMMPWRDYDFAFFRSVNLVVVLSGLCSCFDRTGAELPESASSRARRRQQSEKDAGKLRQAPRRPTPDAALDVAEALRERAWLAVRMLTLSCGLAMTTATQPGVVKACARFMVQVCAAPGGVPREFEHRSIRPRPRPPPLRLRLHPHPHPHPSPQPHDSDG